MSDILIKGMEMPKAGQTIEAASITIAENVDRTIWGRLEPYGDWCPIVEVPPHGRLIDSTIIERAMTKACNECFDVFYVDCENCIFYDVVKALHDTPTIIPASKEGE